ncbi:DoxX family protein [Sediminibacillus halophilus]|uniref:Thiosulfate dehydrogenase [quinone] large subunit n=1 Tax=Sediminibacillus halophilus TaxID=482461 RepID=A0A1G9S394_9BACI|nr:DoxX family protein [Sediminibacillus halophilus]SDM29946.1 thiosulfate dehydrogenase [quinone] large subunit [Sediminibacillus halophilus]
MLELLRKNNLVAGLLAVIRIYLGYQFLHAGIEKLTGGGFDASGFLQGAIASATGEHPAVQGWWATFLEHVALPNATLFSFLVMWGEVLVGIALILGLLTNFATLMGMVMNFAFLFSGTVSTNGQMILLAIFVIVAGANAGKYGLDRWAMPYLRNHTPIKKNHKKETATV